MNNREIFQSLKCNLLSKVIGQETLIEQLLIAVLADGHLLVEGAPGLAKTRLISSLANFVEGDFQRIQFTPDLLPSDITGSEIFRPETVDFSFEAGPIFNNLILADEINRAPAKVQAALLEAMAERTVSVGKKSYPLSPLFLVMATQNPLEQEGTYPLPEAQLDRFLMHVVVDYPDAETEKKILRIVRDELLNDGQAQNKSEVVPNEAVVTQQTIFAARKEVLSIHMAEQVEDYIVQLVHATRQSSQSQKDGLLSLIECGVSPRATTALDRCARAHAWLNGKDFVTPEDVRAVVHPCFRHRIICSYQAEANDILVDNVIDRLLDSVAIA